MFHLRREGVPDPPAPFGAGPRLPIPRGPLHPTDGAPARHGPSGAHRQVSDLAVIIETRVFAGSERHTVELIKHLVEAGWKVALVEAGGDFVASRLPKEHPNLRVVRTHLPLADPSRGSDRAWRLVLRQVPARRVLLVKTWYFAADLGSLRAIRRTFEVVYHIEHSLPPERAHGSERRHLGVLPGLGLRRYRDAWRRWRMSRMVDHVLAVSGAGSRALAEHAFLRPEQISTCPNGVDARCWTRDTAGGREFRLRHGIAPSSYLFGVVARLERLKAIDLAIRAVALLKADCAEPLELCVVGDGPCREELKGLAAHLGIADRVHFTGTLADVKSAYSAIDTYLCTSTTESWPLVLNEAMACGCRLVAAAVGGVPEVAADPICGTLLDSREPTEWARVLRQHVKTPLAERREISQRIQAYVAREHSLQARFAYLASVLEGPPGLLRRA